MTADAHVSVVIRRLGPHGRELALDVINEAARWYREFLPPEEYHEPEMTPAAWDEEARRAAWYGAFVRGALVGVMALEYVRDVALLRHAYVLPVHQRAGVGNRLREHLEALAARGDGRPDRYPDGGATSGGVTRVVVGTYRGNFKARATLEKAGYRLSPDPEAVLRAYYSIPEDRLRSSVTYEKTIAVPPAR
jgi:GNAT superfamily N-acetyltransferase